MRNILSHPFRKMICCTVAAAACLIVMSGTTLSQGSPGGPPANASEGPRQEDRDRQRREADLRAGDVGVVIAVIKKKQMEASIEQMKQDFKHIQLIRNEMVDDLVAKKPLDYKRISDRTEEVNKRAQRLKTFLMPPKPGEKEETPPTPVELKSEEMTGALVKLCNLIYGFTNNPAIKNADVTDAKDAAKAGTDLLSIISLSNDIKSSAERLSKTLK
ncbi:MAG: hypothetical protein WBP93_04875 [Pyrinomonadaceae bacterium]